MHNDDYGDDNERDEDLIKGQDDYHYITTWYSQMPLDLIKDLDCIILLLTFIIMIIFYDILYSTKKLKWLERGCISSLFHVGGMV